MLIRFWSVMLALFGMLGGLLCVQLSTSTTGTDRPIRSVEQAKVNLNTALESDLRKLPRISAGSVKAIVESRTRSSFKDWNDFVARRLVPHFAEHAIKDVVTF